MKTFKIENGDLVFDKFGNIEMVEGKEEVRQSIERRLTTNLGEWFLNTDFGLEYDKIKGKNKKQEGVELAIRECILQDERISEVIFKDFKIDNKDRSLFVSFNAIANDELIEGIEVIV